MNPKLASMLVRLYPRSWRARYGAEFEELLKSGHGGLLTSANVAWSALCERLSPTPGLTEPSQFASWCARAPWAMFGLAPLLLLGGAYFVACFILWSGWKMFLPGVNNPFIPQIDGLAIVYFGIGRSIYFGAPIFVGWAVALVAARQKLRTLWPLLGLSLTAFAGATARVHATRVPGGAGLVSMDFTFGTSGQSILDVLFHALIILSLTALPYLVWRLAKTRSHAV